MQICNGKKRKQKELVNEDELGRMQENAYYCGY
jgi:hypothetical protein